MRNTITRAALFLAIVAPLAACDAPESSDVSLRVIPPSNYWTDGDDGCDGHYLKTESGAICLPPCGSPACDAPQVDECGHQVGNDSICVGTFCTFLCADDSECLAGQRCDGSLGQCVWETQPLPIITAVTPGEWGSCTSGDWDICPAGQCESSNFGSFCSPLCNDDADCAFAPLNECSEEAPALCVAGQCRVPCDEHGGCWGINGMNCNASQQCVWG